ncbi:MAG: hypothetical protein PWQ67_1449 [Clostridia bacterium]|jgi:prenyltransferase beta subunit|nr:hypothetical protein [Clostridia bacterium]MDN5322995.1 hypothetical protein [Clostridia bacterium]
MFKQKAKVLTSLILIMMFLMSFTVINTAAQARTQEEEAIAKAVEYLKKMQNPDGGFSNRKGLPSSTSLTNWVIMALKAAGEDVNSSKWKKNGNSPLDFIYTNISQFESTNDISRTLLSLTASGRGVNFKGDDLAEKIISFQQPNGQFCQPAKGEKELINTHMWAVIALSSAGKDIPHKEKAGEWLLYRQNKDGGFGWAVGAESDPDDTGIAIITLVLLGDNPENSKAIQKAVKYLKNWQEDNGGIGWNLYKANAATDAWAIQGLLAAEENISGSEWKVNGNTPLSHLLSLQKSDGSFKWMEDRESSPALMTAYAIMALAKKPFPVNLNFNNLKTNSLKISLTINENTSIVNGRKKLLDVPPTIINNRTMVPLRFISENLGAEIQWKEEIQTVEIMLKDKKLSLTIGKIAPGLDTPATIVNGRTLVPIRYVSENLGAKVTWLAKERRVEIEK